MVRLRDNTIERVIKQISAVYTCIHISNISSALNLNEEQAIAKVNELEWRYTPEDGFVYPVNRITEKYSEHNFDQAISNLNKYVAFLESNWFITPIFLLRFVAFISHLFPSFSWFQFSFYVTIILVMKLYTITAFENAMK